MMNKKELEQHLDPEYYNKQAFDLLKAEYPWLTKEELNPTFRFEITEADGKYYFSYYEANKDGIVEKSFEYSYNLEENNGDYTLINHYINHLGEMATSICRPEHFVHDIFNHQEKHLLKSDRAKFQYGYDIDVYLEMAFNKLKEIFPWVTKDDLSPLHRYSIEKVNEKYEYIEYYKLKDGNESRRILGNPNDGGYKVLFRNFVSNNKHYILQNNKVIAEFAVPTDYREDPGGWRLEKYDIRKHIRGDYTLFVQAGDRYSGSATEIVIPSSCFNVNNYKDFIDRFTDATPSFGMTYNELLNNLELKKFLGFDK